jgi:hypothetical protein
METQCYVSQAENKAADRIDANDVQVDRSEEFLRFLFLEAVTEGIDLRLRNSYAPESRGRRYPVSSFLGECSPEAQSLLFAACHLAEKVGRPNTTREREAAAAHMLRKFVERVASEYAENNAADLAGSEE